MITRFSRLALGIGALALAAPGVQAQSILMPDTTGDQVIVFDGATGDQTGSFSIAAFTSTPINCIDGPGGTLLLSDQVQDMVFQLDAGGNLIGNYLTANIDNLRGINLAPNGYLLGAANGGFFAWDTNGDALDTSAFPVSSYFDVEVITQGTPRPLILLADITSDNLEVYDTAGNLVNETLSGSNNFPEQGQFINTPGGVRYASNSFSDGVVYVYNLDGTDDYSFDIAGSGRGIVQLLNGNLLVSSSTEVAEYTVDGTFVRQVLAGSGFRYLEYCDNYVGQ